VPFPFDPGKLQIMRWPFFKDMTDHDRLAIYTYLSSVPCIAGPNLSPANPMYPVVYPVLHNLYQSDSKRRRKEVSCPKPPRGFEQAVSAGAKEDTLVADMFWGDRYGKLGK
jgi:hypothetical protein